MGLKKAFLSAFVAIAVLGMLAVTFGAQAATPPQAAGRVYADDQLWATFGTATLPPGPSNSFDTLYHFPGTDLIPVSNAGPMNPLYNGGRWMVENVAFTRSELSQFTDGQQVLDAAARGSVTISGPVQYFQCPLFPL